MKKKRHDYEKYKQENIKNKQSKLRFRTRDMNGNEQDKYEINFLNGHNRKIWTGQDGKGWEILH